MTPLSWHSWRRQKDIEAEREIIKMSTAKESKYLCPRCGLVIDGWPCLTAKDAKQCGAAKDAGIKPKLHLVRK